jgi:hypothetical protein
MRGTRWEGRVKSKERHDGRRPIGKPVRAHSRSSAFAAGFDGVNGMESELKLVMSCTAGVKLAGVDQLLGCRGEARSVLEGN